MMTNSGKKFLEKLENCYYSPYLDSAGYPTIGIGHKMSQSEYLSGKTMIGNKKYDWRNKPLTRIEVEEILNYDLNLVSEGIKKVFDLTKLFKNQSDALISFIFNIGINGFYQSTCLKKLQANIFSQIPKEFKRWVYTTDVKTGKKIQLKGLVNRRVYESNLWEKGIYNIS